MSKSKRLPPPVHERKGLAGPDIDEFGVVSWCPTSDGTGPATAVAIVIKTASMGDLVMRIKSPERVDQLIQMLLRHKRDVWPEAP